MKVEEEDLYTLGEALEAQSSILQGIVTYDMNIDSRDYSRAIETLYNNCLKDYNTGKKLLEEDEEVSTSLDSSTSQTGIIVEDDDTSWIRLEYDKLGEKLMDAVETHQETLKDVEVRSGRERLEHAMTNYETLAWNIPPSYDLSLEYVDLPPLHRDGAEIMKGIRVVE